MLDIRDRLDIGIRDELLFKLRKLNTEASEALYQFEELGYLSESRDILYYLVRDSKETLDYVQRVLSDMKESTAPKTIRDRIREALTDNTFKKMKLSSLIISGKITDDTILVINNTSGLNLATGNWFHDKVLEYTDRWGTADISELPRKVIFTIDDRK